MPQLSAVTLRLALIQGSRDKIIDKLSGRVPAIPRGNGVSLQCAIFRADPSAANLIDDLANIASITLQARADGPTGAALFDKTVAIADFDNTGLTWADWADNSDQHFTVELTATETAQDLGSAAEKKIYLAFEAIPVTGDPIFLGSISTVIFEDGIGSSGSAVVGDPTYLTAAQARAEFPSRGITCADFRSGITALTGGGSSALDGVVTVGVAAGYLIAFEISGQGVKHYRLRAGTTAEASPGIIRPDDYAGGTNEKYWEAV
jgi:hypothetical protein